MTASLYLLYDSFTDDFLDSIPLSDLEDEEVVFIASDIAEDIVLAEDESIERQFIDVVCIPECSWFVYNECPPNAES